jgi:hypothetical protein
MRLRSLPFLLAPLFCLACIALAYLGGHDLRSGLLHADALYLPTLFHDLLHAGGRLSDWYLTPAPYYFPDYPLYLAAYALAPDSYLQVLVFALLQCGVLLAGSWALARRFAPGAALPCAAFSLVLLLGLALSAQEPFVLLLSNASHFGAFLAAVLCVLAWLRFEDTGARGALWLAGALAFATTLSDSLFLLQAALPLTLAGAARLLREPAYLAGRRRRALLPWVLVGGAVLGHLGYKVLVMNRTRYKARMDLQHIAANLHDLSAIALRLWEALPLFGLAWLAFLGFALACALRLARGRDPFGLPRALAWLLVFWLVSLAGALAVSLLVTNIPVAARYFIPAACWPILLAPLAASRLLRARTAAVALAGTLACSAAIGVTTFRHVQAHPLQQAYYTDDIACLDGALAGSDLHHGIAQYWDAKTFQRFSRHGIELAQHDDGLQESRWITSKRYFREAYDFALVGPRGPAPYNIPVERLQALNGAPAAQVQCGGYTVWLYGRGALRLR